MTVTRSSGLRKNRTKHVARVKNKTTPTRLSVKAFLRSVDNAKRREDCEAVIEIMRSITGEPAKMWGTSIIGFGSYHYKYASGREGEMCATGLSPRKQSLVLYIMAGFGDYDELLAKLGKFKTGKSCLYVNKLEDVHLRTLKRLIRASVQAMRKKYASS